MGLRSRVINAYRAFVLGQAVVDQAAMAFGVDNSQYSPPEYGDYVATSNGVHACVTLRADLLSSLPIKAYRLKPDGEKEEVTKHPVIDLLNYVNPHWTLPRLLKFVEQSLCVWGSAYLFLERGQNGMGKPTEIWWGRPDRVLLHPDPVNYIGYYTYHSPHGSDITYKATEVVRLAHPNIADEFNGLSALAAARLAADYASAGMMSNKALFEQGLQTGGFIMPPQGKTFTKEQATELETAIKRRFMGADKAHKWGVLPFQMELNEMGITPHDAEFLDGMKWSLEDICRAFKVPIDLIGGQRTYENVDAAYTAIWINTIVPEAKTIAAELTEQLLPMFTGVDELELYTGDVAALQEDENQNWLRASDQITQGAITINEWRTSKGLPDVAWGNVWWGPFTATPISDDVPMLPASDPVTDTGRSYTRAIEYGSAEHQSIYNRFVERTKPLEDRVTRLVVGLFEDQQDAILKRLDELGPETLAQNPFDMGEWQRIFRSDYRPVLAGIVKDSGDMALNDLQVERSYRQTPPPAVNAMNMDDPAVIRFLEGRGQRFAERVNETTWNQLVTSLSEGIINGESIPEFEDRIIAILGARIKSTPETIARTEVVGANNGGTLLAWVQSEIVANKKWIATLDKDTRDTHLDAHNSPAIPITSDFVVGTGRGQHPGALGVAKEDINCRCSMIPELVRIGGANYTRLVDEIYTALERLQ